MKLVTLKLAVAAAVFSLGTATAVAGDFTNVPYTTPDATVVSGAPNPVADQLFLNTTGITWATGFDGLVAQTISYNATGGSGTLNLLSFRENDDIQLAGQEVGDLYDFVYQDSRDGKLVFGTRLILEGEEAEEGEEEEGEEFEVELNFIYRGGFTNYSTAAAWAYIGDNDLRMYNAARTDSFELDGPFDGDADLIRFQADISPEEGNPISGLYLVKTDATAFALAANAIGYYQAGEEGQAVVGEFLAGYAPTAVPEPESYALMMLGLGAIAFARRQRKQA